MFSLLPSISFNTFALVGEWGQKMSKLYFIKT